MLFARLGYTLWRLLATHTSHGIEIGDAFPWVSLPLGAPLGFNVANIALWGSIALLVLLQGMLLVLVLGCFGVGVGNRLSGVGIMLRVLQGDPILH